MKAPVSLRIALILIVVFLSNVGLQADWPTYQHDSSRSGSTAESAPKNPVHAWMYQSPMRPIPAWDEPALWDGYSKTHDLKNRQVFDKVFHVVESKGRVFFGSSIDEQVHCLDAKTGKAIWNFYTEGPVRLAPTIHKDRVYVGSDDGFVYCLSAESGNLIWKQSPGPQTRRISGNGRVISPWAIRTSVVIEGNTAYCGAGVIPSEGVYVVAMDLETGKQKWKTEMTDLPAQGYMLASKTRLYVVTSRDTPVVLDANTGERLFKVKGGTGGTYALLAGDTLLYGPSKTGDVNMVGEKQDVLASFQGNHMIIAQPLSYLQSKAELSSLDRGAYVRIYAERNNVAKQKSTAENSLKKLKAKLKELKDDTSDGKAKLATQIDEAESQVTAFTKQFKQLGSDLKACLKWRTKCECPFSLILSNNVLIAGGDGEVIAVDATNGKQLWQREVPGKAYGLAISNGQLFVSTDEGTIHCFADGVAAKPIPQFADRPVRHQSYVGPIENPERIPPEIFGPFTEFIAPGKVQIEWDTPIETTSTVRFGVDMTNAKTITDDRLTKTHSVVVDDVQREVVYRFQVGGVSRDDRELMTEAYRFDTYLNYLPARIATEANSLYDKSEHDWAVTAKEILRELKAGQRADNSLFENDETLARGVALVVGATDGHLALELARHSDMRVVVVEPNATKAAKLRERLSQTNIYGARISVHVQDLESIQYGPFLANLIVSESMFDSGALPCSVETMMKSLRPAGGTIVLGYRGDNLDYEFPGDVGDWDHVELVGTTNAKIFRRGRLPNTGEWSHQYGNADNSACSKDDLIQGEMMVQWWGRPGARPMPDRGPRNPPPVSANGRLYVQGNRTLFGLDAYNGTVLWAKQIPTMRRANMPRDGSNMVAADEHVCVAMHGKCVAFDGQTGKRLRNFEIPDELELDGFDWGYVSRIESNLFGSAVRPNSQYIGDKGEWYETSQDKDIAKVTSDAFFSVNAYTGTMNWAYSDGQIINSTITVADGLVFFVESRSDAAKNADRGRLSREVLQDQVLVAIDAVSGEIVWQKPYDFSKCEYVAYVTHGNGTVLVTGTDKKNTFHTYAFDSKSGKELWQHDAPMKKGHHTGQLAHPTIVGELVYFNKHTYKLRTGEVLGVHNFDWHGCGVMSASNHTVFSRYEYHGMLDLDTNKRTEFLGIRSGCWLSLIPSGGLLLAPETSAGCSCGHSIQTSIAYVPKQLAATETKPSNQK